MRSPVEPGSAPQAAPMAATPSSWRCFMLLLGEHRARYALLLAGTAAAAMAEAVLHPLLMKSIFDTVSTGADFSYFVYLVIGYLALGLTLNGFGYLLSLWELKLDNKIVAQASTGLLAAFFTKTYRDVLREGSGYYVARIRSDVKDGLVPMLALIRKLCASVVMFITLIGVLIFISWQAFLILSAIIPIATFVSLVVSKKIRGLTIVERDSEASLLDTLTRSVNAFKLVCTFKLHGKTIDTFSKSMADVLASGYRKYRVLRILQGASDITMVVSDVCSIFVGALFVFRKQMSIGSFIAFMNAFWRSATTLIAIFQQWAELQSHSATVNRLVEFLQQPPTAHRRAGNAVCATAVSYGYGAHPVLSDFSIRVDPGTSLLIVGQNGSGKTTLANLLAGHLVPSAGRLELPSSISAVTLPLLFPPLAVRELGVDADLLAAFHLDSTGILDACPDTLSAGQQQKLSLALALSQDAELYVLDEPLANLDMGSRRIAMEAIAERTCDRMLVMIMHGAGDYEAMFDQVHRLGQQAVSTVVAEPAVSY